MDTFPEEFTLQKIQAKYHAARVEINGGQIAQLRKLFYEKISRAVDDKLRAVIITVDEPTDYGNAVRKIVSGEIHKRFPGALYKHCQLERLDIDRFEPVDGDGVENFEFMVVLDPELLEVLQRNVAARDALSYSKSKITAV
jgi:hypothetical protein